MSFEIDEDEDEDGDKPDEALNKNPNRKKIHGSSKDFDHL